MLTLAKEALLKEMGWYFHSGSWFAPQNAKTIISENDMKTKVSVNSKSTPHEVNRLTFPDLEPGDYFQVDGDYHIRKKLKYDYYIKVSGEATNPVYYNNHHPCYWYATPVSLITQLNIEVKAMQNHR